MTVTAIVFAGLGMWFGGHPGSLPGPLRDTFVEPDSALRSELIMDVRENFYRGVSSAQLKDASLHGMVASLHDPYSEYFSPKETRVYEQGVNGEVEGVGMTIDPGGKGGLHVHDVVPGSPAQRAGIRRGDEIVVVNGRSVAGQSPDVTTARIRGPAGTPVTLGVRSPGSAQTRSVTVRRARIQLPVATGRIVTSAGRKLGVVRLTTFSSGAHAELRKQLDRVLAQGARGIVLDLRGNGGGLLQEGVAVGSIFVEKGLIVSTRGRSKPEQRFNSVGGSISPKIPLVVLVDEGTASAAEIVAGALRDHRRATVVGTKTFGKGVFQELEPLSNHGTVKITVGSYYLPNGENLAGHGIEPSVRAPQNVRTIRDEALPVALKTLVKQIH
ncbi:MAG: hypothetical protein NVSMB25_21710 [Thermoleophilaceae bacterium]